MQRFEARYKHKLVNRDGSEIGVVCTFKADVEMKVGSKLFLDSVISTDDVPEIDDNKSFYMGADKRTLPGSPIMQLLSMLRGGNQAAVFFLDSKGTKGYLIPVSGEQRSLIHEIYPDAFRCCVATDQAMAAAHYNTTVRNKSERHLSQIFHLRNLNNWVKSVLIGEANTIISNGWSSWAFQKSQILEGLYSTSDGNYPIRRKDLATSMSTSSEDILISHLVSVRSKKAIDVLDFGCGKGGDIGKWLKCEKGIGRYVGVDIAKVSLEDFADRVRENPKRDKIDRFICADMGVDDLDESELNTYVLAESAWKKIPRAVNRNSECDKFDVASCQFAMHYMFQTAERADHFFENLSRHLEIGGSFIATTMDSRVVADAVQRQEFGPNRSHDGTMVVLDRNGAENTEPRIGVERKVKVTNESGKVVMSLDFDKENWDRLINFDTNGGEDEYNNSFGIRYEFMLDDGMTSADGGDSAAVKAPEWLVPLGRPLEELAKKHDLEVIYCQNFQGFVQSHLRKGNVHSSQYKDLLFEMDVMDIGQTMSYYEWEIARFYLVLIFRKRPPPSSSVPTADDVPGEQESRNTDDAMDVVAPEAISDMRDMVSAFTRQHAWNSAFNAPSAFAPTSPAGGFAPTSPDGAPPPPAMGHFAPPSTFTLPPGMGSFAPTSPDGPPPGPGGFAPCSPDAPPPGPGRFAPCSPGGPPPGPGGFAPCSPDAPPPGPGRFAPSSPDGPPPGPGRFAPSSPDGPPPGPGRFVPSSPDAPPPGPGRFAPSSPDGPPPGPGRFAPSSPDAPPPGSGKIAPSSPDGPPPGMMEDDAGDAKRARLLNLLAHRARAIELAGGDDIWDELDDAQMALYMERTKDSY